VAYGAAVNAAIIGGKDKSLDELLLIDVTPLSLGVETEKGVMDVMIPRQTSIPERITRLYSTAKNNQTSVTIHVYEGERQMTKYNNNLGSFKLDGIPPRKRGASN